MYGIYCNLDSFLNFERSILQQRTMCLDVRCLILAAVGYLILPAVGYLILAPVRCLLFGAVGHLILVAGLFH
jgi:hypothetical protein